MNIIELREKVKLLPQSSGCYIMKDDTGTVIYVGKAKKLRNRVKSYFDNSLKTQKTYALVKNIVDFDYVLTVSEQDAFSLENNLIKKYKPKYNILLKDDKNFPYIKIDMAEKFPRVQVVRRPKKDGSMLFGPYVTGVPISELMHIIKSAFPVRWCNKNFSKTKLPCKACLHGQIGDCIAPCTSQQKEAEYKRILLKVIDFLNGDTKGVRAKLQEKMDNFASTENFEEALEMRNAITMLDKMESKVITSIGSNKNLDVFALAESDDANLSVVNVMTIRGGQTIGQTNYLLPDVVGLENEIISSFIVEYYWDKSNLPAEIVCKQVTSDDIEPLQQFLIEQHSKVIKITIPQKGIKHQLYQSALNNAKEYANRSQDSLARKKALTGDALVRLAEILNIDKVYRIEGYDISNISGTNNVASMVVFEGGEPNKKAYRKFKIKSVDGANDFACMEEALSRRLKRLAEGDLSFGEKPDVILIDGGLGQLHSAQKVASDLGLNITFISLAKKEELVYTTTSSTPIVLSKSDWALRLLVRVRDESHRFAVMFHRNVRTQKELSSVLSQIEGVGKTRREALFKHFKSLDNIANATVENLCEVDGISHSTALSIYNYFNNN